MIAKSHATAGSGAALGCSLAAVLVLTLSLFGHPARGHRQTATECAIYAAAVAEAADSHAVVLLDSTSGAVPGFAFRGISEFGRSAAQQGLTLSDSLMDALEGVNKLRQPLGACLAAMGPVHLVSADSLAAFFQDRENGWRRFRARFPDARRFVLVSRPVMLGDTSAVLYVAYAADWLDGSGVMMRLARDSTGRWVRRAEALLWVS